MLKRCIKNLNIRTEIMKIRIKRFYLYDLKFLDGFLGMTPKERVREEKNRLIGIISIKNLCVSKDIIQRSENIIHRMRENICK